jgi:hypothetical protein
MLDIIRSTCMPIANSFVPTEVTADPLASSLK